MAFNLSSALIPELPDVPVAAAFGVLGAVASQLMHGMLDNMLPIPQSVPSIKSLPKGYYPGLRTLLELGLWFGIVAALSFSPVPFMTTFGLTMFSMLGVLGMWTYNLTLGPKDTHGAEGLGRDMSIAAWWVYYKLSGNA